MRDALALTLLPTVSASAQTGSVSAAGSLTSPRFTHTATLLKDGRVLLVGGVRGRSDLANARVTAGGVAIQPDYAGASLQFPGVDQINLQLPRELAGKGEVSLELRLDGVVANPVRLTFR